MRPCKNCPHKEEQHDEDGFCEVENGVLGFCKCERFEEKEPEADE